MDSKSGGVPDYEQPRPCMILAPAVLFFAGDRVDIAGWKTLIVDDNVLFRQQLEDQLQALGFGSVDHAANVVEAAAKTAGEVYDIVFLDLRMPGKSGYNLLQQCREDRRHDKTAFVVVSAEADQRYIHEASKAGAIGYIVKPVLPKELQKNIERITAWRGRLAQVK
jgi:CheY-like chemotaxis protein